MTSSLDGLGSQRHAPTVFTSGKDPVPIVQEAGTGSEGSRRLRLPDFKTSGAWK